MKFDPPRKGRGHDPNDPLHIWAQEIAKKLEVLLGSVNTVGPLRVPAGVVVFYAGEVIPQGYIEADGRVVKKDSYPQLVRAFGDTYNDGSEAADEIRIPDLRMFAPGYVLAILRV